MKKIIIGTLLILSMFNIPTYAYTNGWHKYSAEEDGRNYWYYIQDNNEFAKHWKKIDENWYYFIREGEGYVTVPGWREIDGNWYYFNNNGVMLHDTMVDGYYLNSNGAWTNETNEMRVYANLLYNTNWQKNNGVMFYDNGKSTINNNWIIDIDQDGVYEMLFSHGTCSANLTIAVVTYNSGDIKVEHLDSGIGGYRGYSSSQKVFFTGYTHMDSNITKGYKLENGKFKKVYSSESYEYPQTSTYKYTVNGQKVSKEDYEKSFEQFGNVITGAYGVKTINF